MSGTTRTARLGLESLEDRRVPAAVLTASLGADGVLRVEGTEGTDSTTVRNAGGFIRIDGVAQAFPTVQVKAIAVDLLGGDDSLWLNSETVAGQQPIAVPATVRCGAGNDVVVGGMGNDVIVGGAGNDQL